MKRFFPVFILLVIMCESGFAQDTIRVMTYNLLNYNYPTTYCTNVNNNVDSKDGWLKTIIDYTLPDIIAFNEVKGDDSTRARLKGSVLNTNGRTYYVSTVYPSAGSLTSFLFFNKNKFDESYLVYDVNTDAARDFKIYRLKLKDSNPAIYVYIIPAHLKAGSYNDDISERAQMVDSIMSKIDNTFGDNKNCIVLGDFNFYSNTESGFQKFVNGSNIEYRFFDPVNQMGAWNSNYTYRFFHTQSTSSGSDDCKASGGMDDRFDIMLVDDDIISGASDIKYIEDSYTTLGQDGNHFNESIINGGNTSVPANVLNALSNMSDHLPVYADFVFGTDNAIFQYSSENLKVNYTNPVQNFMHVQLFATYYEPVKIQIYSIAGKLLLTETIEVNNSAETDIDFSGFTTGIYLMTIKSTSSQQSFKVVKM